MSEHPPSALLCAGPCRPDDRGGPRRAMPNHAICDVCEERCWEDLHWIADHWVDLEKQLTRPESHAADGMPHGQRSEETGIELNEKVSGLRTDIVHWLHYWTRVILDENPGFVGPRDNPVTQARYVAQHSRRITRSHDASLATALPHEARKARRKMFHLIFPARLYTPDPEIPCAEHTVSDMGERVPCPGHYQVWVNGSLDGLPDLHCSEDKTHTLSPSGFKRAGRTAMQQAPTDALVRAIMGG